MNIFEKFKKEGLGAHHELLNPKKLRIWTKFDPSRSIFEYFLKSGAIYSWLVQILSFFGFRSSWGAPSPSFLNFSKIFIFASVADFRRFSVVYPGGFDNFSGDYEPSCASALLLNWK